jgi:hypothetical protein
MQRGAGRTTELQLSFVSNIPANPYSTPAHIVPCHGQWYQPCFGMLQNQTKWHNYSR